MKVKDLKLTISPQFDLGETARFTKALTKGTLRAGGSMAKGFAKAYNKLGKTSMYAQYIMSSLRSIYEVLTKSNRTIEKGWNLATGTLRKTSRATGLTEGQISAFAYGFSKAGISTEDSTGLLEGFALQQRINDPYNTDPANLANRAWSALMELKGMDPVRNRIERNEMSRQYFGVDAEKGGLIDTILNNETIIRGGFEEFKKLFKNPEKITDASKIASGFADKEVNSIVKHTLQILLKGHSKKTLETPHYEKQAFRDQELAELDHKDYTSGNVKRAIQQYLSVQGGLTSMTKTLSNKISELLERWGGVDKVVDRVVNGFENLVKQVDKLATAIEWIVQRLPGFGVATPNLHKATFDPTKTKKQRIEEDLDFQRASKEFYDAFPKAKQYETINEGYGGNVKVFDSHEFHKKHERLNLGMFEKKGDRDRRFALLGVTPENKPLYFKLMNAQWNAFTRALADDRKGKKEWKQTASSQEIKNAKMVEKGRKPKSITSLDQDETVKK